MRLRCIHDNQRRLIVTAAVLLVPLLVSLLLAPVACTRIPEAPPPRLAPEAVPDVAFNQLFTRFGNGWTGGDGTLSMGLPDGRTLWLFGDTFLGHVRTDNSRPLDSPLIRNCLVIQDGEKFVSRHGGTIRDPVAFLVPEDPDTWYWPGDRTVWGNHAWIFSIGFARSHRACGDGPGMALSSQP